MTEEQVIIRQMKYYRDMLIEEFKRTFKPEEDLN
jgi:hypothetical protein